MNKLSIKMQLNIIIIFCISNLLIPSLFWGLIVILDLKNIFEVLQNYQWITQNILYLAFIGIVFLVMHKRKEMISLKLTKKDVTLIFVSMIIIFALNIGIHLLFNSPASENQTALESMLLNPKTAISTMLFVTILAPIGEELFFRGVLQESLTRWFGAIIGIIVSSLIFASIHLLVGFENKTILELSMQFLPYASIAFIFGIVYHKSQKQLGPTKVLQI